MFRKVVSSVKSALNHPTDQNDRDKAFCFPSADQSFDNSDTMDLSTGQKRKLKVGSKETVWSHRKKLKSISSASNISIAGSNKSIGKFSSATSKSYSEIVPSAPIIHSKPSITVDSTYRSNYQENQDEKDAIISSLQIRIHELETLVLQKDQIIKILKDDLNTRISTPSHRLSTPKQSPFSLNIFNKDLNEIMTSSSLEPSRSIDSSASLPPPRLQTPPSNKHAFTQDPNSNNSNNKSHMNNSTTTNNNPPESNTKNHNNQNIYNDLNSFSKGDEEDTFDMIIDRHDKRQSFLVLNPLSIDFVDQKKQE